MNKFWIFVFLSFCSLSVIINAVPQKCNQAINYFEARNDDFNCSMTSTFTLSKNAENKTVVSITNISLSSKQEFIFEQVCIFRDLFLGYPFCVSNLNDTLGFQIDNSTFYFRITVNLQNERNDIGVTYGLIDEENISFMTGEMYKI